ncbi:MAG: AfsR/SARP family transcriptional regulator, partial [Deltaproteobacteria bacterium]|nr:bacterial transcriptional activator domain-containing protein [Candidatus Deferrimicrobiaceae bacterium]
WEASFYHYLAAWEALHEEDLAKALFHSGKCRASCEEVGNPWSEALSALQGAFVFHRKEETEEAARLLEHARRIGEASRMQFIRFACLIAKAYFSLRKGGGSTDLPSLREGLRIGREKGYVDLYLWSPGLQEIIASEALERGIETEYVREFIRKNALAPSAAVQDIERWPWPLKIYTLGRFELLKEEKPFPRFRKVQHKPLMMLKALISMGGRNVSEAQLTDVLWPDADGDRAHQSFAMNLSRLRRLLGNEKAVVLRDGRLTLDPACCWVDAFSFESLLSRLDDAAREGRVCPDGAGAAKLAERALSLYRGPFLPGEVLSPWTLAPRERLRSKFLRAVEFLGRCLEREGQWAEAVACYRKGLEVDDLAEGFYQRLMVCQRRLGRDAEALNVYHRCRKALAAALGIPPSPETEAIVKPLL